MCVVHMGVAHVCSMCVPGVTLDVECTSQPNATGTSWHWGGSGQAGHASRLLEQPDVEMEGSCALSGSVFEKPGDCVIPIRSLSALPASVLE